ncbi:MAG: guanylate kinase, partial [Prochloron sp. SP5CPC1]|nr:guanylate kinase [Candidatus Paraprochloron terpiosi SP5CPC1]
ERRLDRGKVEMAAAGEFDYQIVNDDLYEAIASLEAIIEESYS